MHEKQRHLVNSIKRFRSVIGQGLLLIVFIVIMISLLSGCASPSVVVKQAQAEKVPQVLITDRTQDVGAISLRLSKLRASVSDWLDSLTPTESQ